MEGNRLERTSFLKARFDRVKNVVLTLMIVYALLVLTPIRKQTLSTYNGSNPGPLSPN